LSNSVESLIKPQSQDRGIGGRIGRFSISELIVIIPSGSTLEQTGEAVLNISTALNKSISP
jgi:hypothetical protein